jgi:hypothetical protein
LPKIPGCPRLRFLVYVYDLYGKVTVLNGNWNTLPKCLKPAVAGSKVFGRPLAGT